MTLSSLGVPGNFILTITADLLASKDATALAAYRCIPASDRLRPGQRQRSGDTAGPCTAAGHCAPRPPGNVTLTDGVFGPFTAAIHPVTGLFNFTNIPVMPGGTNYQMDAAHSLYLTNRKYSPRCRRDPPTTRTPSCWAATPTIAARSTSATWRASAAPSATRRPSARGREQRHQLGRHDQHPGSGPGGRQLQPGSPPPLPW